jgi:hypothetical protein
MWVSWSLLLRGEYVFGWLMVWFGEMRIEIAVMSRTDDAKHIANFIHAFRYTRVQFHSLYKVSSVA